MEIEIDHLNMRFECSTLEQSPEHNYEMLVVSKKITTDLLKMYEDDNYNRGEICLRLFNNLRDINCRYRVYLDYALSIENSGRRLNKNFTTLKEKILDFFALQSCGDCPVYKKMLMSIEIDDFIVQAVEHESD